MHFLFNFSADYQSPSSPSVFNFQPGNPIRMCTTVTIIEDGVVEEEIESFLADLVLTPIDRVNIDPMRTRFNILDSDGMLPT